MSASTALASSIFAVVIFFIFSYSTMAKRRTGMSNNFLKHTCALTILECSPGLLIFPILFFTQILQRNLVSLHLNELESYACRFGLLFGDTLNDALKRMSSMTISIMIVQQSRHTRRFFTIIARFFAIPKIFSRSL